MTVIFAAKFDDGVVIGSDSRSHDHLTQFGSGDRVKVRSVSERVAVAKAGYGPDSDPLIEDLIATAGVASWPPSHVAQWLWKKGQTTYELCKLKAAELGASDPGLFMIVAGIDDKNNPEIYYLNFQLGEFIQNNFACTAFGPDQAHYKAVDLYNQQKDDDFDIDEWARELVDHCRSKAPHAIGYPIRVITIDPTGSTNDLIDEQT